VRKYVIASVAALTIAGSTAVYAQYRPWFHGHMRHTRLSPEDRTALADARIAGIHAGLKLTSDQEKLWPPVETALRDFSKMRIDRANARMKAQSEDKNQPQKERDPMTRVRERADNMAASAAALKKIVDATAPLYKTLDDGQKRRFAILTHDGRFGAGHRRHRWADNSSGPGTDHGDRRG